MQTTQQISFAQLGELVAAVYSQGPVFVRQAYSEFGCTAREFADAKALLNDLNYKSGDGETFRMYTIYYLEAKGHTYEQRIELDPRKCDGHTFRFRQEGWGLIQLQCDFRKHPIVECCVAVNSKTRAETWSDTHTELESPDAWDWTVIERKAGKLVRLLRRLGNNG